MTTSTTGLRPPPESQRKPEHDGTIRAGGSQARAQRSCGNVLDLVSQRAKVEAEVHRARTSGDQTADSEYAKARQALADKLERLDREAVAEDEKQRRAIVTAAIEGENKAKAEFAAGSRKIATLFDAARDERQE